MLYEVALKQTDEGFAVWCLGLPGCASQGITEEEALENIKDAIHEYLLAVRESNKDEMKRIVEVFTSKNKNKILI